MPSCAKPPKRPQTPTEPPALVSTREALLKLGHEVAQRHRKRVTLPALPSAIDRFELERTR